MWQPQAQPDDQAAASETGELIKAAVAQLSEAQAEAFGYWRRGMNYREIAASCGCSEQEAWMRVYRARIRLKMLLR